MCRCNFFLIREVRETDIARPRVRTFVGLLTSALPMDPSASYHPGWRDGLSSSSSSHRGAANSTTMQRGASHLEDGLSRLLSPVASVLSSDIPGIPIANQWEDPHEPPEYRTKWNSGSNGVNATWNNHHHNSSHPQQSLSQQWQLPQPELLLHDSVSSQHSRGSMSSSIWGANPHDDYSKSSHTSTSTLLLSSHAENHGESLENQLFLSQLHIGGGGGGGTNTTTNYGENPQNQPPKQPVRRPSYSSYSYTSTTTNNNNCTPHDLNNNTNNINISNYPPYPPASSPNSDFGTYPSFLPSSSQDSNNSGTAVGTMAQPYSSHPSQFARSNSSHYPPSSGVATTSSLQQAAASFYPSSVHSTVPGLVGASSSSTVGSQSWYSQPPPPTTTCPAPSSLAVAAATGRSTVVAGPPPGFAQDRLGSASVRRHTTTGSTTAAVSSKTRDRQRSNRKKVTATATTTTGRHASPPTLKDRSSNVQQHHQQQLAYSPYGGADMKDDMTAHSMTSTTTATTTASYRSYQLVQETTTGEGVVSSSQAIRALMEPEPSLHDPTTHDNVDVGGLAATSSFSSFGQQSRQPSPPILPQPVSEDYFSVLERDMERDRRHHHHNDDSLSDTEGGSFQFDDDDEVFAVEVDDEIQMADDDWSGGSRPPTNFTKKREWLVRMNRKLTEIPVGELDPATVPLSAVMNAWAKTKSAQGAAMVELWLKRAQQEYEAGNRNVVPTTKMYTMAGTCSLRQIPMVHDIPAPSHTLFFIYFMYLQSNRTQWMPGPAVGKEAQQLNARKPYCSTCTSCTSRVDTTSYVPPMPFSMRSSTLGPVVARRLLQSVPSRF